MKKRMLSLLLALVMVLGLLPIRILAVEDSEPNDTMPTAQEFILCDTINGSINVEKDLDWYKFTLEDSGKVTLKVTAYLLGHSIWVFNADGNTVWYKYNLRWDSSLGMRTDTHIIHLTEGTYYILISGEYNTGAGARYTTGDYTIKTDYSNANATEIEDNDNIGQANELLPIATVSGQIAHNDLNDFYKIELPASGKLLLDMTAYMAHHAIYLYNEDGSAIWYQRNVQWDSAAGFNHTCYSTHLTAGIYYVKVTGEYNSGNAFNEYSYGNYTLKTDFINANANEVEPNNSIATAQWIIPNKQIAAQIATNDSKDFFQFTLTRDMTLTIDFTSYMKYYALQLYNEAGDQVWSKDGLMWNTSSQMRHDLHKIALQTGTYSLCVTSQKYFTQTGSSNFSTGNYTFKLNTENPFSDVPVDAFYYDPVLWAVEQGITSGTSGTTFSPNDSCMRAHVVTFLWRAAGSPSPESTVNPFEDVKPEDFYYKAVLWAVENGITTGTDATHFSPFGICNRAQVVTFLHRAFGSPDASASDNPFTDVPTDTWYAAPVLWAVENGITNGLSATEFGPDTPCNRAQVVTFLYRAYN